MRRNIFGKLIKNIRFFAGLLCLPLLVVSLCGCAGIKVAGPLDKDVLLEINDTQCDMGTGLLRLLEAREEYNNSDDNVLWIRDVGNISLAEYIKDMVKDDMLRYTAAQLMAQDLTVFVTDRERSQAETDAAELMDKLSMNYDLAGYGITMDNAVDLFVKRTYYNKVYEKLSSNIFMEISESDTKAIEINYVFIPAQDGIETVEKMRNEIKGGIDFTDICIAYGYTPVLNETLIKGNMPAAFESKAFALRDNEVSEIVETREGYYIIYCLEDYKVTESLANYNRIIADGKKARFNEAYEEFASNSNMRFNTDEWNKYDISTMGQ